MTKTNVAGANKAWLRWCMSNLVKMGDQMNYGETQIDWFVNDRWQLLMTGNGGQRLEAPLPPPRFVLENTRARRATVARHVPRTVFKGRWRATNEQPSTAAVVAQCEWKERVPRQRRSSAHYYYSGALTFILGPVSKKKDRVRTTTSRHNSGRPPSNVSNEPRLCLCHKSIHQQSEYLSTICKQLL